MTEYDASWKSFSHGTIGLEQHMCNLANAAVLSVGSRVPRDGCTARELAVEISGELEYAFRCRVEREVYADGSVYARIRRHHFAPVFVEVARCLTGETAAAEATDEPCLYSLSCALPRGGRWLAGTAQFAVYGRIVRPRIIV
jgi:hypothetical protein